MSLGFKMDKFAIVAPSTIVIVFYRKKWENAIEKKDKFTVYGSKFCDGGVQKKV